MTTFNRIIVGKKFKEIQVPEESIYNLITDSTETQKSHTRYQSKFNPSTKKFYESVKMPHQTMGFVKTVSNPEDYLKKRSRSAKKKEIPPCSCIKKEHKKPPIPKLDDISPLMHDKRDFIKFNVLNALRKPAMMPARKTVDTRKGDVFLLEFSGLVPKFSMKKEFGKMPKYLVKRKEDLDYAREVFMKENAVERPRMLTEEEKDQLIKGLRANLEELSKRYLTLPLVIDTKLLQHRKLELERKLGSLERDTYFLERNKDVDIYVLPEYS
ncbi:enkurin-like [Uloborus diversus]|uniref:enkurin-like n=1 Tax=Uloborus diversus TaxID=327109 RepID=UPI0024097C23|nr:enkurin-like [Uloborus diversus]